MKQAPAISIIVPCYNQAQYLEQCLNSILKQNYINWECIIINDGSKDNTDDIAKKWMLKDNRFKYIEKGNEGVCVARNTGINKSKGEYILNLDADDYISENYISKCIDVFLTNDEVEIVYSSALFFGKRNENWILPNRVTINNILFTNSIYCSAMFKKNMWEKVGGFDVNMIYGYEDWEFWINILKNGSYALQTTGAMFYYRIKEDSRSKSINEHYANLMRNYIYNKHFDLYEPLIGNPIKLYLENKETKDYLQHINKKPLRFLIKKILQKT